MDEYRWHCDLYADSHPQIQRLAQARAASCLIGTRRGHRYRASGEDSDLPAEIFPSVLWRLKHRCVPRHAPLRIPVQLGPRRTEMHLTPLRPPGPDTPRETR